MAPVLAHGRQNDLTRTQRPNHNASPKETVMSNQSNIFNAIQESLAFVSLSVKHLELREDSAALESILENLNDIKAVVQGRLHDLRNWDSRACNNLVMARRPYSVERELIPACMAAGRTGTGECKKKCKSVKPEFQKSLSNKYVLIGPQGIGKSKYAIRLANALVATRIFDEGHDWSEDLESAFVANTLLILNHTNFQPDANTIVFRVQDTSDLLLLVLDLEAIPFDPLADGPDFFKGTKIGDIGAIKHSTSKKQAPGRVIGVYPGSIRVRWQATDECAFETTFLRKTGMAKRAQLSFDPAYLI